MTPSSIALIALFLLIPFSSIGQYEKPLNLDKKASGDFFPGIIQLTSGERIEGEIEYNYVTGILYEKDGKKTKPYTATNVIFFEVTQGEKVRKFYSLPFDIFQTGREQLSFFEVLFERNSVAILSNYSLSYKRTENRTTMNEVKVFLKSENIYLVKGSSGILPFLKAGKFSNLNAWKPRKSGRERNPGFRVINKDLPLFFFDEHYEGVLTYIDQNQLKLNKVQDLVKAVEYYVSIK